LTDEIKRKIISLFTVGMSYRDIATHFAEMYGLEVSNATSQCGTNTDSGAPKAWQQRPLDSHY